MGINLLEKTVAIFMKINAQKSNNMDKIYFSASAIEKFEEKFQPKDTLQKKLRSLSMKGFGQNQGVYGGGQRWGQNQNRDQNRGQNRDQRWGQNRDQNRDQNR